MNSKILRTVLGRGIGAVFLALNLGGVASAAPVATFVATPSVITGAPGATIGWGYEITNNSSDFYVPTALNADIFQWALPLALFDFQVVAPGMTVTQSFVAEVTGLYQLTWDLQTPEGFVNSGVFVLSGDFYSDDPLTGGGFLGTAPDAVAGYSATLQSAASVPEPGGLLLSLLALLLMGAALLSHEVSAIAQPFRRHYSAVPRGDRFEPPEVRSPSIATSKISAKATPLPRLQVIMAKC